MKLLLGKFGIVLIGIAIFGYAEVWGADWKYFKENDFAKVFYDADSITSPSERIVRVSQKLVLKEPSIALMVKAFGDKYNNMDSSTAYFEINCVEKKYRTLQITHYSKNNEVLSSTDLQEEWRFDSSLEDLFKIVCE